MFDVNESPPAAADAPGVTITGVDIPFWHLVQLLVKLSLAAIPAAVILVLIGVGVFMALAAVGATLPDPPSIVETPAAGPVLRDGMVIYPDGRVRPYEP